MHELLDGEDCLKIYKKHYTRCKHYLLALLDYKNISLVIFIKYYNNGKGI